MEWQEVLRRTRDIGLILIPLCYATGYFAWSNGTLAFGLGAIPGDSNRYLALGVLVLLLAAVYILALVGAIHLQHKTQGNTWKQLGAWVLAIVLGASANLALLVLLGAYGIFRVSEEGVLLTLVGGAIMLPLGVFLVEWFIPTVIQWSTGRRNEKENQAGVERHPFLWPIAVSVLMAMVLFPMLYMPYTNPEFGGLLPREAQFDIDANHASPLLEPIFAEGQENSTVRTTVKVWVLHSLGDGYLVRDASLSKTKAPMYEIPKHVVLGVQWHD